MNQVYLDSARLMTRVAPLVFVDDTFALKGGTAINLFVRDMPRLSVDLDLVFPDHTLPRDQALRRINAAIRQSVARLKKQGFQTPAVAAADAGETKLLQHGSATVRKAMESSILERAPPANKIDDGLFRRRGGGRKAAHPGFGFGVSGKAPANATQTPP